MRLELTIVGNIEALGNDGNKVEKSLAPASMDTLQSYSDVGKGGETVCMKILVFHSGQIELNDSH